MATAAPGPSGTVDFGRCFTFVTEDPEWVTKILLGGLFTLLSAVCWWACRSSWGTGPGR